MFLKVDYVGRHLSLNKCFISWSQALGEGLKAQPPHFPKRTLSLNQQEMSIDHSLDIKLKEVEAHPCSNIIVNSIVYHIKRIAHYPTLPCLSSEINIFLIRKEGRKG